MQTRTPSLEEFRARAENLIDAHPVVVDNTYARWFAGGAATREEVQHLAVQFSVFSHMFIEAQLRKVINAPNLDEYHAGLWADRLQEQLATAA